MDVQSFQTRLIQLTEQLVGQTLDSDVLHKSIEELGLDSLMALELAVYVEREFQIRLSEEEIGSIQSLADIIQFVQSRES